MVEEARFQLGKNLAWVGRQGEAVPLLETVLRTRRGALGEHAKETVEAELALVEALAREEGRYEEALALFQHAKQAIVEQRFFLLFPEPAQYALYRGAGGALNFTEWQEAGKPEHG